MPNPGQNDTDGDGAGDVCDTTSGIPTEDLPGIGESHGMPAPTVDAGGGYLGAEGALIPIQGTVGGTSGDTTTWTVTSTTADPGATCLIADPKSLGTTITCTDDGTYTATLTATSAAGVSTSASATVTVTNTAPVVGITQPTEMASFVVGKPVAVSAKLTDGGSNDTHTCSVDWGDGSNSDGSVAAGVCSAAHPYAAIGVYTIGVTATDDDGASGRSEVPVVVNDSKTVVTGGGFITTDGRTSFGFVVKSGPAETIGQLQIRQGKNRFHGATATAFTRSGSNASWSGTGRWNGLDGYRFELSVTDNGSGRKATPDSITITVIDPSGYTAMSQTGALKGGNITVNR